MTDRIDLPLIYARNEAARLAGRQVEERDQDRWSGEQLRALLASWRDVASLYDEVVRLQRELRAQHRGNQEMSRDNVDLREQLVSLKQRHAGEFTEPCGDVVFGLQCIKPLNHELHWDGRTGWKPDGEAYADCYGAIMRLAEHCKLHARDGVYLDATRVLHRLGGREPVIEKDPGPDADQ